MYLLLVTIRFSNPLRICCRLSLVDNSWSEDSVNKACLRLAMRVSITPHAGLIRSSSEPSCRHCNRTQNNNNNNNESVRSTMNEWMLEDISQYAVTVIGLKHNESTCTPEKDVKILEANLICWTGSQWINLNCTFTKIIIIWMSSRRSQRQNCEKAMICINCSGQNESHYL